MRKLSFFLVMCLLITSTFMPVIKATVEREWMAIPPSYSEKYDDDGDGNNDSHKVQIDADTEHYNEVFTVHTKGQMYDRYDDTPLTAWVQVDWQISAPGGVNQLEWSPEMHFKVPEGYTPKEGYPYVRTRTLISLYDDEWNLEQNGDYEYAPWEIRHNLYPPASNDPPVLSDGYVTPTTGDTSTLFYYYVHYYDADGDSPTQRDVVIDGSAFHTMTHHNGSTYDGFYRCVLTLSVGGHNFYFKFSDGVNPPVLLPPSGTYSGPAVSATNVYLIKKYFPVYKFSSGEEWYPCSFYFDGNGQTWDDLYNKESYDSYTPFPPPYYAYVHITENSTHKAIQYWLYYVWNYHQSLLVPEHYSDWDSTVFVILEKTGGEPVPVEVYYFFHWRKEILSWTEWDIFGEKEESTHVVIYVAEGSHGAYAYPEEMIDNPHNLGIDDIWQAGGRILRQEDFNWYLVGDSLEHEHGYSGNMYCNMTVEWIEGEPQWEFDSYWWPRKFPYYEPNFTMDPPWHRDDWMNIQPPPNDSPVLSNGYVTPTTGDTSTLFYYYVHYYDPEGVAPANPKQLCIDETEWHTMGLHNGTASNGFYKCILTLSPGSHNYYFKFSDGVNPSVRLPVSDTYPGPTVSNDPPVLSNGYMIPTSGTTSTLFYYYVHYYDANGDAPTQRDVCIDGTEWHTMTHHNGSVSDGYYRLVLTLSPGTHNFYFKFSDGVNPPVLLPPSGTYPGPTVSAPPVLSDGYVTPTSGNTSTLFYYYVHYYDSDGDAPTQRDACIDGTEWHTMTHHNGSIHDGFYRCILTLSVGNHNYYFKFSDGVNPPVLLPSSNTYSGPPVVSSGHVELCYDDGIAEDGYGPTLGLYTYAVHFQPPATVPYKLSQVKYYIYDKPASFYVDIRDGSLQQLYFELVTPTQVGWFVVDLTAEEIFVSGDFYVGMKYSQLYEPELGADYTYPDGESGESLHSFPTPNLTSLDWMIRAYVMIQGDVNGDGIVDIYDLARISETYGSMSEDQNWDANADVNSDEIVDVYDVMICGKAYGQTSAGPTANPAKVNPKTGHSLILFPLSLLCVLLLRPHSHQSDAIAREYKKLRQLARCRYSPPTVLA